MRQRAYNLNPGPSVLPESVIEEAREDVWSYKGSGMGVAELSHRGPHFEEIIQTTEQLLRELLLIPASYSVLFCTGGATQQFSMVPMNLLRAGEQGNYLLSGVWSEAAAEEAKKFGAVSICGSSKDAGYRHLPHDCRLSERPSYLHFTSNNTVVGTQFRSPPPAGGSTLICDASSDIASRSLEVDQYGLIYAGAQKNLGPAGVTIVIIRNDLLDRAPSGLPILLDYRTYAKNKSLYNTPPTLPIYLVGGVLSWLKNLGGIPEIERRNREKAEVVYRSIDRSGFYTGLVERDSRSLMNLTFRLSNAELDRVFLAESEAQGFFGLKGHRLMGGFRASMYNAFPLEGAKALAEFLDDFEKRNG